MRKIVRKPRPTSASDDGTDSLPDTIDANSGGPAATPASDRSAKKSGKQKAPQQQNKRIGNTVDESSSEEEDQLPRRKSILPVKRHSQTTSARHSSALSADDDQQTTDSRTASTRKRKRVGNKASNTATPMSAALIKSLLDIKFKKMEHTLLTESKVARKKRARTDAVFQYKTHKIQHKFNGDIQEDLEDALEFLENKDFRTAKEHIRGVVDALKQRNKKIRIADRSKGGWKTVRFYETDELASDTADEKKIDRAEKKALKEMDDEKVQKAEATRKKIFGGKRTKFRNASPKRATESKDNKYRSAPICYGCGRRGHIRANCKQFK